MKGQSWNWQGILKSWEWIAQPNLLKPRRIVSNLSSLDFDHLYQCGFRGIAFDKDNTLTAPYALEIHPPFKVITLCSSAARVARMSARVQRQGRDCVKFCGNTR